MSIIDQDANRRDTMLDNAQREAQEAMEQYVLGELRTTQLVGFGFQPPRRLEHDAVVVPPRAWSSRLPWPKGDVTHEGLTFTQVRIIEHSKAKRLAAEWREKTGQAAIEAPVERTDKVSRSIQAFEALAAVGEINLKSLRSNCDPIRNWLRVHHGDEGFNGENPSDETIRKACLDHYDTYRLSRSSKS